jgi:hypothetical protein
MSADGEGSARITMPSPASHADLHLGADPDFPACRPALSPATADTNADFRSRAE